MRYLRLAGGGSARLESWSPGPRPRSQCVREAGLEPNTHRRTRGLCLSPRSCNAISRLSVSWLNRLETTGFGLEITGLPPQPLEATRSLSTRRPLLHRAQTSLCRTPRPPRRAPRPPGPALPGRTRVGVPGCRGKAPASAKRSSAPRSRQRPRRAPAVTGRSVRRPVAGPRAECGGS